MRTVLTGLLALTLLQNCLGTSSSQPVSLTVGQPGLAIEGKNLLVAIPVMNETRTAARKVEVETITLNAVARVAPKSFPILLGDIPPEQRAVVEAAFSISQLKRNERYLLSVTGTHQLGGRKVPFSIRRYITLPPAAPGQAQLRSFTASPHHVRGAQYAPSKIANPREMNRNVPPVPTGTLRGDLTPSTPATTIESGDTHKSLPGKKTDASSGGTGLLRLASYKISPAEAPFAPPPNDLVFVVTTANAGPAGGIPFDPTIASSTSPAAGSGVGAGIPQTILAAGNTYASFSSDGGQTFTTLNPTTIFPNTDASGNLIDGGLCCDQVIHYSASIDRFFWLMLFRGGPTGQNRLRLAVASPKDLVAGGGTAWGYWDLTSSDFKIGANILDYPDLSVGKDSLYLSVDGNGGLIVARIALSELLAGGTISVGFTDPAVGTSAYGVHLIQNPWDEMFWAGHPTNSTLRVFSLKEGSNTYYWRDVDIKSYPNKDFTSVSSDGTNWLQSLFSGGPDGVRLLDPIKDEIMFEWMGARGGNFKQPHIQIARIKHSDFSLVDQTQIWNPDFAFGYASFTMANSLIGVSLAFGGPSDFGSPAVGILGDGVFYEVCASTSNAGRFGDYATVRQALPGGGLLAAEVYCVDPSAFRPLYVLFGRSSDVDPPPIQ